MSAAFLLLLASGVWRLATASEASPPYRFAPGDVLEISVTSHPGYDRTVVVRPDGNVSFPIVGEIPAVGLTVLEFTARLEKGLEAELIGPRVLVSLKESVGKPVGEQVSVLGAVRSPALYDLKQGWRLTEALAAAGGPTATAKLDAVTLARGRQTLTTIDLSNALGGTRDGPRPAGAAEGDANPLLQAGDLIIVPTAQRPAVTVLGEVQRPATYELPEGARVMDALTQAGPATSRADLRHATISHADGSKEPIDLERLLKGDPSLNRLLRAGDCLVVPLNPLRVYVLGEVSKPDVYAVRPEDSVLDVVLAAGGLTREANPAEALLIRRASGAEKPETQHLPLQQMLTGSRPALAVTLREGDVILVPSKKPSRSVMDYLNALWPLSALRAFF